MNTFLWYTRWLKAFLAAQFMPLLPALILFAVFWMPGTTARQNLERSDSLSNSPFTGDRTVKLPAHAARANQRNSAGIAADDTLPVIEWGEVEPSPQPARPIAREDTQDDALRLADSDITPAKSDSVQAEMLPTELDSSEPRLMNGVPQGMVRSTAGGIRALAESGAVESAAGLGANRGTARFFGLTAQNTHTVAYVIDCSGSMGSPPRKLHLAKQELIRSIQDLLPEQSFYVVFFSHETFPMPSPRALAATEDNKERVFGWIDSATPTGGTNPLPAVMLALQLQPETVYVLSDGLFKGDYVRAIGDHNRGSHRSSIYTINFGDHRGEHQLQRLARENGGHYRYFVAGGE